jgi:hypothetical protein
MQDTKNTENNNKVIFKLPLEIDEIDEIDEQYALNKSCALMIALDDDNVVPGLNNVVVPGLNNDAPLACLMCSKNSLNGSFCKASCEYEYWKYNDTTVSIVNEDKDHDDYYDPSFK